MAEKCRNNKLSKGIASDKYEIGEVVVSDGKSMTEIELKQDEMSGTDGKKEKA